MKLKLFALLACVLVGCAQPPQSTKKSSNSAFEVEFLFENEGIKVYRFSDAGKYIYFTNVGQTRWAEDKGRPAGVN